MAYSIQTPVRHHDRMPKLFVTTVTIESPDRDRVYRVFFFACLFVAALLTRIFSLNLFLTPDEYRWIGRSRNFLLGLVTGDLAATAQVGHPGVTTMWTGSLGILFRYVTRPESAPADLAGFVSQVSAEPVDLAFIIPVRMPTVVLTSLFVVTFAWLLGRLLDNRRVGFFAGILLCLSPFFIGTSRVLHTDALATSFLTVSLLTMLGYWLKGWGKRWLWLSGICAGLAFMSKSPTMFLMPFCALVGVVWGARRWRAGHWQGWSDLRRLVADGLTWGVAAWVTAFVIWPAMWVEPSQPLGLLFGLALDYGSDGHVQYFFGKISDDPGTFFYPLMWLLRTMPFTILGFAAWIVSWVAKRRRTSRAEDRGDLVQPMIFCFVVLFFLFMASGDKKQDRYILPIFPAVDALAAVGLLAAARFLASLPAKERVGRALRSTTLASVLFLNVLIVVDHYPYYFTYYNPLLGGVAGGARVATVGWGEGLNLAADYLNRQPNADKARATSWYALTFAPFFHGSTVDFKSDLSTLFTSEYAVVYVNQVQRERPTAATTDYLAARSPVFTGTLHGLDYVHVYDVSSTFGSDGLATRLDGRAVLFAVDVSPEAEAADQLLVRVTMRHLGPVPGEPLWAGLLSAADGSLTWWPCALRPEFAPTAQKPLAVVDQDCVVEGTGRAPGLYSLRFGVGTAAESLAVLPFPAGDRTVEVDSRGRAMLVDAVAAMDMLVTSQLPADVTPAGIAFQDVVRLVGYSVPTSPGGGGRTEVNTYWQAFSDLPLAQIGQSAKIRIAMLDADGTEVASGEFPFMRDVGVPMWSAGQVLRRPVTLDVPASAGRPLSLRLAVSFQGQALTPFDAGGVQLDEVLLPLAP